MTAVKIENKEIYLLGTSHVAKASVNVIKSTFEKTKPDILAVELDARRFNAMLLKNKNERTNYMNLFKEIGFSGTLFYLLARTVQNTLGRILKITPGIDMLTAVQIAQKENKKIYLIDRDIKITLKRISLHINKKDLFKMLIDSFKSTRIKHQRIDISKIPDQKTIDILIGELSRRYPKIYNVLIKERDIFMADALLNVAEKHPNSKILAVVGAGHIKGMINKIEKQAME